MLVRPIALTILIATLLGCASQTTYRPADKSGTEGYTETKLTNNRYRVTFTGNSVTPAETVKDYTLLRAAELTLQEGFDWFELADRNIGKKTHASTSVGTGIVLSPQTDVYQRCGLLRCSAVVETSPGISSGEEIATTSTSTSYSSTLEIVLAKYPLAKTVNSYDARQLASTLRRQIIQPK